MSFATPLALAAFIPVAVYVVLRFRGRALGTITFSSLRSVKESKKSFRQRFLWFPPFLNAVALFLIVVALARPQYGKEYVKESHESVAIEMLMDISSSMDISMRSETESESRLEVAKRVFEQFVAGDSEGLKGRADDLVGMITFARYADTVCPLTLGHDALLYFSRRLHIEDRQNEDGTAIGDALALGAARLQTLEEVLARQSLVSDGDFEIKSKVIILLTDGENNSGKHLPMEGAALAEKWGIRIHTIGFGDKPEMRNVETADGVQKVTPSFGADTKTLIRIAEATGGLFRMAHDSDSLRSVYEEIDQMEKSEIRSVSHMEYKDVFHLFALAALACLFIEAFLRSTLLRTSP